MNRSKENTWRKLNGEKPLKSMEQIVADFQKYVESYHRQAGYENYSDVTFIEDILYGLGQAMGQEYQWAPGFDKFKDVLREHLEKTKK